MSLRGWAQAGPSAVLPQATPLLSKEATKGIGDVLGLLVRREVAALPDRFAAHVTVRCASGRGDERRGPRNDRVEQKLVFDQCESRMLAVDADSRTRVRKATR